MLHHGHRYVCVAKENVRKLLHNMQHDDTTDTYQESCDQQQTTTTKWTLDEPCRGRLQKIRRLLAAAEVGLMHMETARKLQNPRVLWPYIR